MCKQLGVYEVVLVCSELRRTLKLLYALAHGLAPHSSKWVSRCVRVLRRLAPQPQDLLELPGGLALATRSTSGLFAGVTAVAIGSSKWREEYMPLMRVAGADVCTDLKNLPVGKCKVAGRAPAHTYPYVSGGERVLSRGLVVLESASENSSAVSSAMNTGTPIVLIEWVKKSLMERHICKITSLRDQIKQEAARQAKTKL